MGASVVIGAIGLAFSAASTVKGMMDAKEQKKDAKKQEAAQKAQIAEKEKQAELTAQVNQRKAARAARLATAQTIGQTGGLVGGSVVTDPIISQQSSLEGSLDIMNQQSDIQSAQFDISREQAGIAGDIAASEATAAIWKNLFGFADDVVSYFS